MQLRVLFLFLGLAVAATGCAKVKAAVCIGMVPAESVAKAGAANVEPKDEDEDSTIEPEHEEPASEHAEAGEAPPQEQFALPFAWQSSPKEPLSRTRAYLREVARDNAAYMRHGTDYFKAMAETQTPRATVLACADSRVQAGAFDASPENDAFTIRNIGNQVENGLGSIEYGVEHLRTPLLVVLGHTGCGAVKAALGDISKLSDPIRLELTKLKLGKRKLKTVEGSVWREGVLKNIHNQVETALSAFAPRVNAGQLTIIGAIYDFRNELGKGPGKVSIVNVNGITEPSRLKSFEDAVMAGAPLANAKALDPFEKLAQVFAGHMQGDEEEEEDTVTIDPKEAVKPVPPVPPKAATAETVPAKAAAPHAKH